MASIVGSILLGSAALTALVGLVTLIEILAPIDRYSLRQRMLGFVSSFVSLVMAALFLLGLQNLWGWLAIEPLATLDLTRAGSVAAIIAGIIFADFLSYWFHRFEHRFLWPIHAMHHSQTQLHAANGYGHFAEKGLRFLLFAVPLSLVRFDFAAAPFALVLTRELLERYIHSPTTLHFGPLSRLFVDNRFHRIHHSIEPQHLDRNFGIMLSIWDRLFGTASEPVHGEWPATGVVGVSAPGSLVDSVVFPLRYISDMRRRSVANAVESSQAAT